MTLTSVLLADLSPMLEGIVRSLLQSRTDLNVVRGSAKDIGLAAAAAAAGARLVVVSCRDPADLRAVDQGVAQAANLSVYALNEHGSAGCVHVVKLTSTPYDDGLKLMGALEDATLREQRA